MVFNSYVYIFVFLPTVLLVYQALRTSRYQNHFLAAASLFFYAYNVVWYIVPLVASSVLDYVIGGRIARENSEASRRRMLLASVCINIGLLSFFKYTGWLSRELADALAVFGVTMSAFAPPLPPGISFYTFQTMSYTIDIYRREYTPHKNFVDYMSFVSFFPQLVAGPIERAKALLPQIAATRPAIDPEDASRALFMILFGLFQKMVIADNVGGIVESIERVVLVPGQKTAGLGLIFAYAFAFQIYCDFAAYSLIAIGSARLFGIQLSRNFLTPYFASSPSEFWRRWHISLSSWLRDYLYVSLGGNRGGRLMTLRNLLITMTLGGLWHGAGTLFIVWGIWHGLLLVLYRLVPIDEILQRSFGRLGKAVAVAVFFHLVCIGWIFFRATPQSIGPIWASMLAIPSALETFAVTYAPYWSAVLDGKAAAWPVLVGSLAGLARQNWLFSVYLLGVCLFGLPMLVMDYFAYRAGGEVPDLFHRMPMAGKAASILGVTYAIAFFGRRVANEFIYFQF